MSSKQCPFASPFSRQLNKSNFLRRLLTRTANWLGYSSSALYTLYKTLSKVPIPKLKFTHIDKAMCQNFLRFL